MADLVSAPMNTEQLKMSFSKIQVLIILSLNPAGTAACIFSQHIYYYLGYSVLRVESCPPEQKY